MYKKFIEEVESNKKLHPEWRLGQTMFNTLYKSHPNIADLIRGTTLDPFYKKDDQLEDFLQYVKKTLDKRQNN